MFSALAKTLGQLNDPAFKSVLGRALAVSLAVFVAVWVLAWFGLGLADAAFQDWLAAQDVEGFWRGVLVWVFEAAFWVSILFASFLLFPAVATVAMGFFLEEIAEAVERKHYPGLPPGRRQPIREVLGDAVGLAIATIVVNLLALPLYLLLLFIPPLNLFVFYGINGYLLGREYFELVAVRRLESPAARRLRRRYRGKTFLAGVIITFLFSIPIVNLLAPIVATGLLVHVFERLRQSGAAATAEAA